MQTTDITDAESLVARITDGSSGEELDAALAAFLYPDLSPDDAASDFHALAHQESVDDLLLLLKRRASNWRLVRLTEQESFGVGWFVWLEHRSHVEWQTKKSISTAAKTPARALAAALVEAVEFDRTLR